MRSRSGIRIAAVFLLSLAAVALSSPAQAASDAVCGRAAELIDDADPGAALLLIDTREQELDALAGEDTGALCPNVTRDAIAARGRIGVEVLYGDHELGQRSITLFVLNPRDDGSWLTSVVVSFAGQTLALEWADTVHRQRRKLTHDPRKARPDRR